MSAQLDPKRIAFVLGYAEANDWLERDRASRLLAILITNHRGVNQTYLEESYVNGWNEVGRLPSWEEWIATLEAILAEIAQAKTALEQERIEIEQAQAVDLEIWGWINDL